MANKVYDIHVENPEDSPEKIATKLNRLHRAVKVSAIEDGMSKTEFDEFKERTFRHIEAVRKQIDNTDLRWHGSGLSAVAHDSSLSGDGTAGSPLSSILTATSTSTLTNKRLTPRVLSAANYTTDTGTSLNSDNLDWFIVTAQAGALKFNNPSGTPTDGQALKIAVTGTASRALTWDTQFEASTVALPTTTATTARLNIGFVWRADTSKWVCVAIA